MLKINDFAILSKTNIPLIRHYRELGLIEPAVINDKMGEEYYLESQIRLVNNIQMLRSIGYTLEEIREIIRTHQSEAMFKEYVRQQLNNKQVELEVIKNQIELIENTLYNLEPSQSPLEYKLVVKEIPERRVVSWRGLVTNIEKEELLWKSLKERAAKMKLRFRQPIFEAAVIHSSETSNMIDIEVQKGVVGQRATGDGLTFKILPEMLVAVVTFPEGYKRFEKINVEVANWLSDHQFELAGEIMSVYQNIAKGKSGEQQRLTELYFPIQKRE